MTVERARGLCLLISLCIVTGNRRLAEGYLLELLAWLTFSSRTVAFERTPPS